MIREPERKKMKGRKYRDKGVNVVIGVRWLVLGFAGLLDAVGLLFELEPKRCPATARQSLSVDSKVFHFALSVLGSNNLSSPSHAKDCSCQASHIGPLYPFSPWPPEGSSKYLPGTLCAWSAA
jgi:hypothetical protein